MPGVKRGSWSRRGDGPVQIWGGSVLLNLKRMKIGKLYAFTIEREDYFAVLSKDGGVDIYMVTDRGEA